MNRPTASSTTSSLLLYPSLEAISSSLDASSRLILTFTYPAFFMLAIPDKERMSVKNAGTLSPSEIEGRPGRRD